MWRKKGSTTRNHNIWEQYGGEIPVFLFFFFLLLHISWSGCWEASNPQTLIWTNKQTKTRKKLSVSSQRNRKGERLKYLEHICIIPIKHQRKNYGPTQVHTSKGRLGSWTPTLPPVTGAPAAELVSEDTKRGAVLSSPPAAAVSSPPTPTHVSGEPGLLPHWQ